jgi:SAM-dependent methyltransferase
MTTPFDSIAPRYGALWSNTGNGWKQRSEVWNATNGLFRQGDLILDLGCGTGDDALHFGAGGIRVEGIDSSREMVEIARLRGVNARRLAIEGLRDLERSFDGAISNFGALNCVPQLGPVADQLGRLIRPGGSLALCLLSRFYWRETLSAIVALDFRKAARRWSGRSRWRGIDIYYPSSRHIRAVFDAWFEYERRVSIGHGDHTLYIFRRRKLC